MNRESSERFAGDVATVMTLRLASLPFMWMTNPKKAERETKKMFSEKEDAFMAAQQQMMLAPTLFWFDLWQGMLKGDRDGGVARASNLAEKRLFQPYQSRVSANKKRLSKGG